MSVGYNPPIWGGVPQEGKKWTAELIHNGETIHHCELGRSYYLIGRQEDIVNIPLPVLSSSRLHAVIQYNDKGDLFLFDMGSANGTFLNRKRVESKTHVPIPDGSVVTFAGDATCLLILTAPTKSAGDSDGVVKESKAPLDDTNMEPIIVSGELDETQMLQVLEGGKAPITPSNILSSNDGDLSRESLSLGMHKFSREGRESHWLERISANKLTERETAAFDKLLERLRKIQALKKDSKRLQEKELMQGELTQGQLQALHRSMETLEQLEPRFLSDEQDFRERLEAKYPGISGPGFVSMVPQGNKAGSASKSGTSASSSASDPSMRSSEGHVDVRYASADVFGAADWNEPDDVREAHGAAVTGPKRKLTNLTLRRGHTKVQGKGSVSGEGAAVSDSKGGAQGHEGNVDSKERRLGHDEEPVYETEASLLEKLRILDQEKARLLEEQHRLSEENETLLGENNEMPSGTAEEDELDKVLRESKEVARKENFISRTKQLEEIRARLETWQRDYSKIEALLRIANPLYSSAMKAKDRNDDKPAAGTKRSISEI